jgi:hypothetical protein
MKNGYYTDAAGNVLGYWESPEPQAIPGQTWIESDERPAIYIPPNRAAMNQIIQLEASVTLRMMREAFLGSTAVINNTSSPFNGLTSAQAIASVQSQIATLRASL